MPYHAPEIDPELGTVPSRGGRRKLLCNKKAKLSMAAVLVAVGVGVAIGVPVSRRRRNTTKRQKTMQQLQQTSNLQDPKRLKSQQLKANSVNVVTYHNEDDEEAKEMNQALIEDTTTIPTSVPSTYYSSNNTLNVSTSSDHKPSAMPQRTSTSSLSPSPSQAPMMVVETLLTDFVSSFSLLEPSASIPTSQGSGTNTGVPSNFDTASAITDSPTKQPSSSSSTTKTTSEPSSSSPVLASETNAITSSQPTQMPNKITSSQPTEMPNKIPSNQATQMPNLSDDEDDKSSVPSSEPTPTQQHEPSHNERFMSSLLPTPRFRSSHEPSRIEHSTEEPSSSQSSSRRKSNAPSNKESSEPSSKNSSMSPRFPSSEAPTQISSSSSDGSISPSSHPSMRRVPSSSKPSESPIPLDTTSSDGSISPSISHVPSSQVPLKMSDNDIISPSSSPLPAMMRNKDGSSKSNQPTTHHISSSSSSSDSPMSPSSSQIPSSVVDEPTQQPMSNGTTTPSLSMSPSPTTLSHEPSSDEPTQFPTESTTSGSSMSPQPTAATTTPTSTSTPTTNNTTSTTERKEDGLFTTVFAAQSMPFVRYPDVLPRFSSDVTKGYNGCDELLESITNALLMLANDQIDTNAKDVQCYHYHWNYPPYVNGPYYSEPIPMMMADAAAAPPMMMAAAAPQESQPSSQAARESSSSTEDSYGTNNQVDGVEEGDKVKSNGKYVFMAYGDEVIVMDLHGNILTRQNVPPPPSPPKSDELVDALNSVGGASPLFPTTSRMSIAPPPPWGQPEVKREIQSLLLHDIPNSKSVVLNVITHVSDWTCRQSTLCGGLTTAFQYRFNDDELTLESHVDINGSFTNARSIGSNDHIVTNAMIDTGRFTSRLYRCNSEFDNLSDEEYRIAAQSLVNETVSDYASSIISGLAWTSASDEGSGSASLLAQDDSCKHVFQISSMTKNDETLTEQEKSSMPSLFDGEGGILQNFVQITSMDMTLVPSSASSSSTTNDSIPILSSSAAGAFMAYSSPEMYATETDLVLAGRGWRYDESSVQWDQYTFLMIFDLQQGSSAIPKAVGEVPGYLKNQFSLDMHNGYLRVATTTSQQWGYVEDTSSTPTSSSWQILRNSTSQVSILTPSATKSGSFEVVGFVGNLGPAEDIKSVRFLGDRGYVVTFRTVDPLYSLDLSNPFDPQLKGELKITGFSEYMHPIKGSDDANAKVGDYLLTVGKEADELNMGRITGTKISLFDVRDIHNPINVTDHVISNNGGWSSSDVSMDHHAFRYLEESKKLIIPLNVYDGMSYENNFDGFIVYDINVANAEITETGRVTHSQGNNIYNYCWSTARLPTRSMVFMGDLMTFKSHSIKMTKDINSSLEKEVWSEINLDENRTKTNSDYCHGYWPFLPSPILF